MSGWSIRICTLVLALLVSACGGGGGGSGGGPQTVQLMVVPSQLPTNGTAQLTWTAPNAERCWATGAWGGNANTFGDVFFVFPDPGTFRFDLTCEGFDGRETATAVLEVTGPGTHVSMRAGSTIVPAGDQTRITWSSNAQSCEASEDWSGARSASGSETVQVSAGFNVFVLTCTGAAGITEDFLVVRGQTTTIDLEADRAMIGAGQSTELRWFSWDADSCVASGAWSGTKPKSGMQDVVITQLGDHDFTLTCDGPGGQVMKSVIVTAVAPTVSLRAFPRTVAPGEQFSLNWTATEAFSCTASGDWSGPRANIGAVLLTAGPVGTAEYTLSCSNDGGSDTEVETLTVAAPPAYPAATSYQIGPNHAGVTTFPGALVFPLTHAWRRIFAYEVSYPLIADGRVYLTTRHPTLSRTQLFALDLATGDTLWGPVELTGNWAAPGLAYENGRLFIVESTGLLSTFDAATGVAGWTRQFETFQGMFDAPPTAMGGILFVAGRGQLYAVDQATGDLLWQRAANSGGDWTTVTPAGAYVVSTCQSYGFNPVHGQPLWHIDPGCIGGGGSATAVSGGVIYVRDNENSFGVIRLRDEATGNDLGTLRSITTPAVTASQLFLGDENTLKAYSLDGEFQWGFTSNDIFSLQPFEAEPIVVNDRVIAARADRIYALDAATGQLQWTGDLGGFMENLRPSPAAGEGYLVAPADEVLTAWKISP